MTLRRSTAIHRALLVGALAFSQLTFAQPSFAQLSLAQDNVWQPVPTVTFDGIPGRLFLTSDPAIQYALGGRGLLRSEDGGRQWTVAPTPSLALEVVVDPADPQTIFYPTFSTLLRSTDGGRSFSVAWQDLSYNPLPDAVLVSRYFPGRVYLATLYDLWQSTDGGATFTRRGALPGQGVRIDGLAEAADGGLYLNRIPSCGSHGCGSSWGFYRSGDQGESWTTVLAGGSEQLGRVRSMAVHPVRPEILYLSRSDAGDFRLLRSDDRGASFTDLGPLPTGSADLFNDPALPDALYASGRRNLSRSLDRGASWQEIALPVPTAGLDLMELAFASPGRLVIYAFGFYSSPPPSHAGAYASSDGGATWAVVPPSGPFLSPVQQLAVAGPEGTLYASDSGPLVVRSRDGGDSWEMLPGGPGLILSHLAGDPADGDTLYASGTLGDGQFGMLRSRDGGRSFQRVAETPAYVRDLIAFRRGGATTVVAAFEQGVARSADGGDTWSIDSGPAVFLADLEWDGQALYGSGGALYRSDDGGATWSLQDPEATSELAAGGGVVARLVAGNRIESFGNGGPFPWLRYTLPRLAEPGGRGWQLELDRHGVFYLLGDLVFLRSRDRGRSWQALSQELPASDLRPAFLGEVGQDGSIYFGGTSGLYRGRFAEAPLALVRGRFEARLSWRGGPEAPWVDAAGAAFADQGGVFRLFSAERAEVAVQLVDDRPRSGYFQVFVASMTDVELELEIRDRLEGEAWHHRQPAGALQSVADLAAFPRLPQLTGATLAQPFGGLPDELPEVPLQGRFAISVSRPDLAGGAPIQAPGSELYGDTAAFVFDDLGRIDVFVNVIDGRPLNGKFWVFGGSLTDQEFDIRIEDLATGAVWTRHNPAGSFAGFSDAAAF